MVPEYPDPPSGSCQVIMRFHLSLCCLGMGTALLLIGCASTAPKVNQLSKTEARDGWRPLFNGRNLDGWRLYKKTEGPTQGWVVEDGILHLIQGSKAGDIITVEKFDNFDLSWEWRINPKGNNGLKYLVSEQRGAPGPEYQMVDDSLETTAKQMTASFYQVFPPALDKPLHPPGEWNQSRVVVRGKSVEHWLNGKKVLSYRLESPDLNKAIANSKFKNEPTFGKKAPGHIMLTDHGDEVWYRNVKIREL